jgi:prepilin-type N-terminal cleavage/methylation domain-containing protein/prepilin-type processing-associated H-X9-DG protein
MSWFQARSASRGRPAFTLVELLVVIAIIGTLVGLLLPAVQTARESARRSACANNIRQLALACQSFADATQGFLPNSARPGTVRISWITRILPYIEQQALYDKFDQSANWGSGTANTAQGFVIPNAVLAHTRIKSVECGSAPTAEGRYDADPQAGTQPFPYPTTAVRAVVNAAGTGFSTNGLFCAPTDFSPTVYVDAALQNPTPAAPNDNFADVAASTAPVAQGNTVASRGDGLMSKDYGDGFKPSLKDATDGLSNTILLAESAGRPFVYRGRSRADDTSGQFPARRTNAGGWVRPASDLSIDGSSANGAAFRSSPTKVINATNGESIETAPFQTGYYGTDGGGEVYAFHPAGANVAFGDASVKLLTSDISIRLFASLVTRAGGEVIAGDKGKY